MVNAAIIGACAVTLSSAYAFGDTYDAKHSLHRKVTDAKIFYGAYAVQIVLAATIVLIPKAPLGTMTQYVQVLAGVLLPSAILFLLLLCNDKGVLGPWCNQLWQNIVTTFIIGVLVVLSLILVVNTLFKSVDVPTLTYALFGAYAIVLLIAGIAGLVVRRRRLAAGLSADPLVDVRHLNRDSWRMPRLEQLAAPVQSRFRMICLYTLRGYLIISVVLITFKIAQSIWG